VKQGERSSVCRLNLYGLDDEMTVFTTTPATFAVLDETREVLKSDDPDVWLEPFLQKVRDSKVKLKRVA
jgi:type IV secretion system protein VirB4